MKNKDYIAFVFYFFILNFLACTGCTADINTTNISIPVTRPASNSASDIPTPSIAPSFILEVSPKPSKTIPLNVFIRTNPQTHFGWEKNDSLGYDASICVRYNLRYLLKPSEPHVKYTSLFVDDWRAAPLGMVFSTEMLCEFVNPDGTTTPWDCNEHVFCWDAPFHVGVHKITFEVHLQSGKVEEYTWYYEIVEPVATPTP